MPGCVLRVVSKTADVDLLVPRSIHTVYASSRIAETFAPITPYLCAVRSFVVPAKQL